MNTTRYYTDNYAVWKFEHGKPPMHRDCDESHWEESSFPSFEAFEESPGDTHEITADNGGEP